MTNDTKSKEGERKMERKILHIVSVLRNDHSTCSSSGRHRLVFTLVNFQVAVVIVLGVISILLSATGGCKEKEGGKQNRALPGEKDHVIYGRYYNRNDPDEYIDIRGDGAAYYRHKNDLKFVRILGQAEYTEVAGTWKVYEDELLLISPLGEVERGQILNDNSILLDGKSWTRQLQTQRLGDQIEEDRGVPVMPQSEKPQDSKQKNEIGGIDSIPEDKMIWVKCNDTQCNVEYKMSERQYFKGIAERINPGSILVTPALICMQCGKLSLYKAYKCGNPDCGLVFIAGSVPNDFPDRCPECGTSETEETRKRRRLQR